LARSLSNFRLVLSLALLALGKTGVTDISQSHPAAGHGLKDIGLGVVVAVFSLVGFECPTAFGEEVRNPLRMIPAPSSPACC
jgi:amino acid transporter